MTLTAISRQNMKIYLAARSGEGVGELAREGRREVAVIGGNQPGDGNACMRAEFARRCEQRMRRADLVWKIIGAAAAARREQDEIVGYCMKPK